MPLELLELPCPFLTEFGVIRLFAEKGCDPEALLERVRSGDYAEPFVIDDGEARSLYFSLAFTQSQMRIKAPDALELAYTRKMMAFLLFVPQAKKILMLGLGGGSLAKFCHRHLPAADITAVEISPTVIAFRDQFLLPPDGERFRIVEADAVDHVAQPGEAADVIMVDAFDRHGAAPDACTREFYDNVRRRLSGRGVAVINLASERREREAYLDALRDVFAENIVTLPVPDDGNTIAFAFRDPNFEPRWRWIDSQAKALQKRFGLDFPKFADRLNKSRKSGYWQRLRLD